MTTKCPPNRAAIKERADVAAVQGCYRFLHRCPQNGKPPATGGVSVAGAGCISDPAYYQFITSGFAACLRQMAAMRSNLPGEARCDELRFGPGAERMQNRPYVGYRRKYHSRRDGLGRPRAGPKHFIITRNAFFIERLGPGALLEIAKIRHSIIRKRNSQSVCGELSRKSPRHHRRSEKNRILIGKKSTGHGDWAERERANTGEEGAGRAGVGREGGRFHHVYQMSTIMFCSCCRLLPILGFSGRHRIRSSQFLHSRHLLCRSSRLTSTPIVQAPHGSVFSRITGRKVDRMMRSVSQARLVSTGRLRTELDFRTEDETRNGYRGSEQQQKKPPATGAEIKTRLPYGAEYVDQYVLIVHPYRHLQRTGDVARFRVVPDGRQERVDQCVLPTAGGRSLTVHSTRWTAATTTTSTARDRSPQVPYLKGRLRSHRLGDDLHLYVRVMRCAWTVGATIASSSSIISIFKFGDIPPPFPLPCSPSPPSGPVSGEMPATPAPAPAPLPPPPIDNRTFPLPRLKLFRDVWLCVKVAVRLEPIVLAVRFPADHRDAGRCAHEQTLATLVERDAANTRRLLRTRRAAGYLCYKLALLKVVQIDRTVIATGCHH
uniref:Uncharacterized protein n=1 Tax=Anopheles farauti TaxID=69004 RepID=A0A182QNE6_9DIPT